VTEASILTSRATTLERIAEAFRQRDPYYDFRWPPLDARRKKLNKRLADLLKQGHPMECALQHLYEAKWLINYTDDWTAPGDLAAANGIASWSQPSMRCRNGKRRPTP
jgi:hypothetical protein